MMAVYQGYEIDNQLYRVIRYMQTVKKARDDLQKQQISWDYLSVMAQLANVDNELKNARHEFNLLTGTLLNRLGLESLNKSVREYGFKAQVAINVVVRNLFERTADIGFLAQDTDVRDFLALSLTNTHAQDLKNTAEKLQARFLAYAEKYSVYDNVILLDKTGKVLVQMDNTVPITFSKDALIKEVLTTTDAYVEVFRHSDLRPNQDKSLIYAFRIESESHQPMGVICLCFKLEDECKLLFSRLLDQDKQSMMMFLDAHGRVVASSHPQIVPLNHYFKDWHMQSSSNAHQALSDFKVQSYGGSEYLCCAKVAEPYQGYNGPGWLGLVMVPMEKLFEIPHGVKTEGFKQGLLYSAMQGNLFDEETKQITQHANEIQNALNRSVWNGNVFQASEKNGPDAAVSKVLLGEIKNTGLDTKHIFEHSIQEIQNTVLNATLEDCESRAALAMDIMDRNLYERANDCRWWALTSRFSTLLGEKPLQGGAAEEIRAVLKFINSLYTVYSNLLVFDLHGKVLAVSNDTYQHLVGTVLKDAWVKHVHVLHSPQHYVVSDFEPSALYDDEHSYIFAAAIHDLNHRHVVGGVAVVFDSAPQFSAILQDVLPPKAVPENDASPIDEENLHDPDVFAVFVDQKKMVIASSHTAYKAGMLFEMDEHSFRLKPGEVSSKILQIQQHYYSVGCARSGGYREFKGESDQYQAPVYAFVLRKIGELQHAYDDTAIVQETYHHAVTSNAGREQLATFYVGQYWLGLRSYQVASAVMVDKLVPIHGAESSMMAGYMMYKGQSIALIHTAMLLGAKQAPKHAVKDAVVIRVNQQYLGLTIDVLGEMLDVDVDAIQPIGKVAEPIDAVIREVVLPPEGSQQATMLRMLDVENMGKLLDKSLLTA